MKKYLALALLVNFIIGCSASDVSQSGSTSDQTISDPEVLKQKAVEHFVNGSIAESKGDFSLQ